MNSYSTNSIDILESYIKGKDEDQFKILEAIYSKTAELEFEITSDDISFPDNMSGNQEIARILSRDFNKNYSKIKTYYLSKPKDKELNIHQQNWLVVMKDNSNDLTRVGTGYYNWNLTNVSNNLKIEKHKIFIHSMIQLQDTNSTELDRIHSALDYPWSSPTQAIDTLLSNKRLKEVIDYLKNHSTK